MRADCTGPDVRFSFPITQTQLAEATGMSMVHVNRTLKTLREGGLAEARNREVRIMDWAGLVAVGEFDPGYLQINIPPEKGLRAAETNGAPRQSGNGQGAVAA
jgi:hypothetical protein